MKNFGLSQSVILDNPAEFGKYFDDKSIEVSSIDELTPDAILLEYIKKKEWVEEHSCSNIVIALFTTSAVSFFSKLK